MIPPVTPGQTDEKPKMVGWKFFQPAIANIKNNLGKDSVGDDQIREVCRQILEDAKSMYNVTPLSRDSSPYDHSQSEAESETSTSEFWLSRASLDQSTVSAAIKRKEPDSELEPTISSVPMLPAKRYRQKSTHSADYSSCKLSLKRDGPKWDPDRIKGDTLFIMGARANKVLGYGQTRGRLYVRHPNLVRYSGDQEDKEWLASKNLMPPSGGKAYLMLLEDIKELTESEEYKHSPNLQLQELIGFEVPLFLLLKIKNFIEYVRTERKLLAHVDIDEGSNSSTPPSQLMLHSDASTPVDTNFLDMSTDVTISLTSSVISNLLASSLPSVGNSDRSQDF
ncbi:unnamed protein product [Callosobruchus maculatus]|uniref:Uncharacterized protein n=1 Tax=Callosobruchus maculatus TaxID=64391 RepID=A0A653BZG9_CALMS|nr:unnamed protein product [Callosobruchus maculatus]